MPRPASTQSPAQAELFAEREPVVPGLRYQEGFLSAAEELTLLQSIRGLELREAQYRQWQAHRRTISFGGKYDFSTNELLPAEPVPQFLFPLRARVATWSGIRAEEFNHALIAEYRAGAQLGWHRDVPNYESVVGVSLAGPARLRFRPYPPRIGQRKTAFALEVAPRSIYSMHASARWDWQHALSPTKALRYSITFRTLANGNMRRSR